MLKILMTLTTIGDEINPRNTLSVCRICTQNAHDERIKNCHLQTEHATVSDARHIGAADNFMRRLN